jgi:hypothetical protein
VRDRKRSEAGLGGISTILFLVYVAVGVFVANTHNYLDKLGNIRRIISLVLAVLLWPLVLLGVSLHIGGK